LPLNSNACRPTGSKFDRTLGLLRLLETSGKLPLSLPSTTVRLARAIDLLLGVVIAPIDPPLRTAPVRLALLLATLRDLAL